VYVAPTDSAPGALENSENYNIFKISCNKMNL
jgi:hypothetical protein